VERPADEQDAGSDEHRHGNAGAGEVGAADVAKRITELVRDVAVADHEHQSSHGGVEAERDNDRRQRELGRQPTLDRADGGAHGHRNEHAKCSVSALFVEVQAHERAGQPGRRAHREVDVAAQQQEPNRCRDHRHRGHLNEHELDVGRRHELVGLRPEEQHLECERNDDALAQEPRGDPLASRLRIESDAAKRRPDGVDCGW
jgi:hypothetical protein